VEKVDWGTQKGCPSNPQKSVITRSLPPGEELHSPKENNGTMYKKKEETRRAALEKKKKKHIKKKERATGGKSIFPPASRGVRTDRGLYWEKTGGSKPIF